MLNQVFSNRQPSNFAQLHCFPSDFTVINFHKHNEAGTVELKDKAQYRTKKKCPRNTFKREFKKEINILNCK